MTRRRARAVAQVALSRLAAHQRAAPAGGADSTRRWQLAKLRKQVRRNEQKVARLQQRVAALEEEVSETRQIGLQVGHLGDLVTALLARRAAGSDGEFSKDLSSYADDI